MIEMTAEQRARVHPFRGETSPLPDADEGARRLRDWWTRPELFAPFCKRDYWTRGLAHAPPELAAWTRSAISLLEDPTLPAAEPEVEAVLMWMLDYWSRRDLASVGQGGSIDRYYPVDAWFVRRWMGRGVEFALDVLAAFGRFEIDGSRSGQPATHTLSIKRRDGNAWWCLEVGDLGVCHELRRAAAGAKPDGAGRVREGAPLWLRAAIAFVFPDEPYWEADLADAQPKQKSKTPKLGPATWGLVTTRIDEASIPPVLASMAKDDQPFATDTALYGYTLVHRLGDGAAPHLLGYLASVRGAYAKEWFAEALALTETSETRAFFESKVKDKAIGKIARAYLGRR